MALKYRVLQIPEYGRRGGRVLSEGEREREGGSEGRDVGATARARVEGAH
jgi:hypothetical protein